MDLETYVITEIKKVLDTKRGLQSEVAKAVGEEKGPVSNWLTGKRKSSETFRRIAAQVAGLDYQQLVNDYYDKYPDQKPTKTTTFNLSGKNKGAANQADVIHINHNESYVKNSSDNFSNEMGIFIKLVAKLDKPEEYLLDQIFKLREMVKKMESDT